MMSLLFNMLSRFVIAFLPRSKCLLISLLQTSSAVIWEPKKINLSLLPLFPHLLALSVGTPDAMILVFLKFEFVTVLLYSHQEAL